MVQNLQNLGEFTKRAFLNGRIDLSQAEAVIDVINSKTKKEAEEGIKQLEGGLAKEIKRIKSIILDVITHIEVSIDYPEYDIPEVLNEELKIKIEEALYNLNILMKTFENGKILKEGIKTAIIGRPNAGKSSLLNAILKEERAIVTEFEGTTRDTIEELVNISGIPLKIIDTAGIRSTKNEVEKIGIQKSKKLAKEADLVIFIIDCSRNISKEDKDILNIVDSSKTIVVLNKIDLEQKINVSNKELKKFKDVVKISAKNLEGLNELYEKIENLFKLNIISSDNEIIITNQRHKVQIEKAVDNLRKSLNSLTNNMPIDIISIGIKNALEDLGEITGEVASEEIINDIFSKFCLGK